MSYIKQIFKKKQELKAEHLNHMENGIAEAMKMAKAATIAKISESTEDGGSNIITFCDGKSITIKNGHTPVKGVDYWTEEDVDEINNAVRTANNAASRADTATINANTAVDEVETELAQVEKEIVDIKATAIQHSIPFMNSLEELEEIGDTSLLYALPDGYYYAYMLTELENGPAYTNLVRSSIDTGGAIYNLTGYKEGYRLNSSGTETEADGCVCSGFIPYNQEKTFRIYGTKNSNVSNVSGNYLALYDESYAKLAVVDSNNAVTGGATWEELDGKYLLTIDSSLTNIKNFISSAKYIRCSMNTCAGEDFVVTLNEEIVNRTSGNILPDLTPISGLTKNENGLYYGKYGTTSSPYYSSDTNCTITGMIPYSLDNVPTLYIKGVNWDASSSHSRILTMKNDGAAAQATYNLSAISEKFTVTELDTNYYKLEVVGTNIFYNSSGENVNLSHIVLCFDNTDGTEDIQISYEPFSSENVFGYQWTNTGREINQYECEDRLLALESRANALEKAVDNIAVNVDSNATYIVNEAKRVADIVQTKRTVGSLTFTAMSDAHVEVGTNSSYIKPNITSCRDAGLGLAELQKHIKLDMAVMLGDYSYADPEETVAQVKSDLSYFRETMSNGLRGIPNIWCTGNHDINYGASSDRRMTEDELYSYITGNNTGVIQDDNNIGRNYGYIDFKNQKIRCVYLNTVDALDYPDNTGTADDASEITAIQTQWLVDVGLNVPTDEWQIIIFSHHSLNLFTHVMTVLEAYRDGISGSVSVTTNGVATTVSYNFTSSNRGEIIANIHGHNHNFSARKISSAPYYDMNTEGWLWRICIPNMDVTRNNECATYDDAGWVGAFGEFDSAGNPVYYPKKQGTATSTSFCCVTIDRKNRKIHAIAYGAGIDRELNY